MSTFRFARIVVVLTIVLGATSAAHAEDVPKLKFEVFQDKANEYRWRLKSANGTVLATAGQGYKDKSSATHGIELVQKTGGESKLRFEFYEDAKKEHRWRLKAGNAQTVAVSGEGYKAKSDAETAVAHIKAGAANAEVIDAKE